MSTVTGRRHISPMHILFFSCLLLIRGVVHALPVISPLSVNIAARVPLAPKIKLEREQIELDGVKYTIIPLTEGVHGDRSHSFKIEGGFEDSESKLVPAILKRVYDTKWKDDPSSDTLNEIGFLNKPSIGLHLFSKWSKRTTNDPPYQIDIVVRDITTEDPPFKSFLDWYLENKDIRAIDGLQNTMRNIKERLMWYAMNENLIYYDVAMVNIFIREQAMATSVGPAERSIDSSVTVMPVDWAVDDGYFAGVMDISALDQEKKQEQIQAYKKELDNDLDKSWNTRLLAMELMNTRNQKLRSDDIKKVIFNHGATYELHHLKTLDHSTGSYAVVSGIQLENKDDFAFMYVVDLTKDSGESKIEHAKVKGYFVRHEVVGKELYILCLVHANAPDSEDTSEDN